jgi:hypothetical protein
VHVTSVTVNWGAGSPDNPGDTIYVVELSTANDRSVINANTTTTRSEGKAEVTGLNPGTTYYGWVRAINRSGEEVVEPAGVMKTKGPVLAEALAFVSVSTGSIRAEWGSNTNGGDTEYYVEYSSNGIDQMTSGWIVQQGASNQWIAGDLLINTSYYFKVKAKDSLGYETPYKALGSTWTLSIPVSSPTVNGYDDDTYGTYTRVHISSMGALGQNPSWTLYAIRNTEVSGWLKGDGLGSTSTVAVWKTYDEWESGGTNIHSGLAGSTVYHYVVRAMNGSGIQAAPSAIGQGKTPSSAATNVQVIEYEHDKLHITWTDASGQAVDYKVYYATEAGSAWTYLGHTGSGSVLEYYDKRIGTMEQITGVTLSPASTSAMTVSWDAGVLLPSATRYYSVTIMNGAGSESRKSGTGAGARYVTPIVTSYKVYRDGEYLVSVSSEAVSYKDSTLTINTSYSYCISGVSSNGIEGSSSTIKTAYTQAGVPGKVTLTGATTSSIEIGLDPVNNPACTEYKITVSSDEWLTESYVQAGGTLSAVAVWQTSASWASGGAVVMKNDGGNVKYGVRIVARNQDLVETVGSSETVRYTLAVGPAGAVLVAESSTTIRAVWDSNGNSELTQYRVWWSSSIGGIEVSSATVVGTTTYALGLEVNTSYYFETKGINGEGIATSTVPFGWRWTRAAPPLSPGIKAGYNGTDGDYVEVVISTSDGNPVYTEYAIWGSIDSDYYGWLQDDGSVDAGAKRWHTKGVWDSGQNRFKNLLTSTEYVYRVIARNGEGVETVHTPSGSGLGGDDASPRDLFVSRLLLQHFHIQPGMS